MEVCPRPVEAIASAKEVLKEHYIRPGPNIEIVPPRTKAPLHELLRTRNIRPVGTLEAEFAAWELAPEAVETKPGEWDGHSAMSLFDAFELPLLKQLACRLWSIPASSAPAERVFSLMGRIDRLSHSRLLEDKFEQHTFLKANKHL